MAYDQATDTQWPKGNGSGPLVISVAGDVDVASAPRLHEQLVEALERDGDPIVVDLREISFIDSTGLGVLINARQRARGRGAALKLVLPEGNARFPFEVTGLVSVFDTEESTEDQDWE